MSRGKHSVKKGVWYIGGGGEEEDKEAAQYQLDY